MALSLRQFVENLVESGLFSAAELSAFQERLPSEKCPRDAQGLARELILADKLTKYQAAAVYQGKTKGLVFDEYVVLDAIGAGGMGEVFKAKHRTMRRVVALKVLPPRAVKSPDAVERFHREVRAAAKLTHPNIVTAYDAREHQGMHCLVMEYVDGKDLANVLADQGPLPVEQAVDYVIQAAKGLQYAHSEGIVHRDIKPGNLLLDKKGTVKILDMGLARIDQPAARTDPTAQEALTESGQVMGTWDYMAPEQAEDTHHADHRADIYSLGCTLYRLLTGQKPYQGETAIQIMLAHCQAAIPSLCQARPDVPAELDAAFQKMLAKRPEDRQQSMGEVIADLEACLAREKPISAARATGASASSSSDRALNRFLQSMAGRPAAAVGEPKVAAEETIARHAEEDTHGTVGTKTIFAGKQKTVILASVAGAAAVLVVILGLVLTLGRGGGDAGQKATAEASPPAPLPASGARGAGSPTGSKPQPEAPAWQAAWTETDAKAKALAADGSFGEAEEFYRSFGEQYDDLQLNRKVNDAVAAVHAQAETAYHEAEARARQLSGEKKFAEARKALDVVINRHGIPANAEAAKKLLAEIDAAEQEAQVQAAAAQAEAARMAQIKKQQVEQRYAEAMKPIEELVAAWDFREASAALAKVEFEEEDLALRLGAWREGVKRLEDLKARIIANINTAEPRLKKSDLQIRGAGGEIVRADEQGIEAKLSTGKAESLPWPEVGPQAIENLMLLARGLAPFSAQTKKVPVPLPEAQAADRLAAGILSLASGDPTSAEHHFDQARAHGADIGPYLAPLAATAFAKAQDLLEAEKFSEAESLLANIEPKYTDTPWFASNRAGFDAARAQAQAGIYETEAEKLHAEAADLFKKEQLFDVKPLVEKLRTDYANSHAATDTARKPSFADMEKAVADLGQFITVRLDGKGDFTTIQAAIDAAPPNSLIEIQDDGPYREKLVVPRSSEQVSLRGKKGCWPLVTSAGVRQPFAVLFSADGPQEVRIERIALIHTNVAGDHPACAKIRAEKTASLHSCVVYGSEGAGLAMLSPGSFARNCIVLGAICVQQERFAAEDSFFLGKLLYMWKGAEFANCLIANASGVDGPCKFTRCTFLKHVEFSGQPSQLSDCIAPSVEAVAPGTQIRYSNIHGRPPFVDKAKPGEGCLSAPPMFVNPGSFDYRLLPTSPCIGKASDGGDIGCRYTPEMIEMIQKALELRAKGIIKL